MLSKSSAAAAAQQQQAEKSLRSKESSEQIKGLRSIVREHQVCYEIWPMWSVSNGVNKETGFELWLCGLNGHVLREESASHPVFSCEQCWRTYVELRDLAEWILRLKNQPLAYRIDSFDHALHLATESRQHRSEVIITTAIFQPPHRETEGGRCESECLKEVREKLAKLGIREDVRSPKTRRGAVRAKAVGE